MTAVLYRSLPPEPEYSVYASSMIRTFPTVVARIDFVLASDCPITLPIKSAGFLVTTNYLLLVRTNEK